MTHRRKPGIPHSSVDLARNLAYIPIDIGLTALYQGLLQAMEKAGQFTSNQAFRRTPYTARGMRWFPGKRGRMI